MKRSKGREAELQAERERGATKALGSIVVVALILMVAIAASCEDLRSDRRLDALEGVNPGPTAEIVDIHTRKLQAIEEALGLQLEGGGR